MKISHLILLLSLLGTMASACKNAFMTKEKYLAEYDAFIEDVRAQKDKLTEADWAKLDQQHERYSTELYNKFKAELSTSDNIHVKRNQISYIGMKGIKGLFDLLGDDLGSEVEQSVDELKSLMKALDSSMVQ